MKKKICAFLSVIMILSLMTACGDDTSGGKTAGVTNPKLVKSATVYIINEGEADWSQYYKTEYTYEGKYPIKSSASYADGAYFDNLEFDYTFDGDVPASLVCTQNGTKLYTAQYSDGKLSEMKYDLDSETDSRFIYYMYSNNDDYYTALVNSIRISDSTESDAVSYNSEEFDDMIITTENGLLKKTVSNGVRTSWMDGEDKQWTGFNGKYIANYDSNGILNNTECTYKDDQTPVNYTFDVTVEDGLVTEVVRKYQEEGSDKVKNEAKVVFEYTDTEIDAGRYSRMINAHIIPDENPYYIYNWY